MSDTRDPIRCTISSDPTLKCLWPLCTCERKSNYVAIKDAESLAYQRGFTAGAESMRELAVQVAFEYATKPLSRLIAQRIRDLPTEVK